MLKPVQIETRARELLDRVRNKKRPPVDVELVAKKLGLVIRREPFNGDLSGALSRRGSSAIIGINSLEANVRQRFTVAHEIGHYELHSDLLHLDPTRNLGVVPPPTGSTHVLRRTPGRSETKDPREIEANRFAAALLMPVHFLASDLRDLPHRLTDKNIKQLAERYLVSTQAMTFRLMNLGVTIETV